MAKTIEERRAQNRECIKRWRAEHPEQEHQRRIKDAIRLLERDGYRVVAPFADNLRQEG